MKLGIIGLPQTGKTTIFNALTGHDPPTLVREEWKFTPPLSMFPIRALIRFR